MVDDILAQLTAHAIPGKAAEMAQYHKAPRSYLGVANPVIDDVARNLRQSLTLEDRLTMAGALWDTDIHEARVCAAKLFTQARIRPDDTPVWEMIQTWVPQFDAWAIADHACSAGAKRVVADPSRLDQIAPWTRSDHMWTRRAALVITLPWTKQNNPKPHELAARDRILGWAATYVDDRTWFIQKSISWWLRELSRHDPDRTRAFLAEYGNRMKPFARKDAARKLPENATSKT